MDETGLLEVLFERMPMGIVVLDRDFKLRRWNQTWQDFLVNYRFAEAKDIAAGVDYFEILPETRTRLKGAFQRVLQGESIARSGVLVNTPVGETYWDIALSPLIQDGEVAGIIDVATEATERVTSEILIEEREEQYRAIFEATSDALFITTLRGTVVEVNPAACEIFGYTREELLNIDPMSLVHPTVHEHLDNYFLHVREDSVPPRYRTTFVGKSGQAVEAAVYGRRFTYRGKPHLLTVVRDVSEEQRAMDQLEDRVEERTAELEALLSLSRHLNSTLTLKPILQSVLDQICGVVPYDVAAILVLEGDELVVVDTSDNPGATGVGFRYPVGHLGDLWNPMKDGQAIIIPDLEDESNPGAALLQRANRLTRGDSRRLTGSWLGVPIRLSSDAAGAFVLSRREKDAFTGRHAELAGAVATQVAIAIENANLYTQSTRRVTELEALTDMAGQLTLLQPMESMLRSIAATAAKATGSEGCMVTLVDGAGESVTVAAQYRMSVEAVEAFRRALATGYNSQTLEAIRTRQPVVIRGLKQELLVTEAYAPFRERMQDMPWDSVAVAPLVFQDQSLGSINCYFAPGNEPTAETLVLLNGIADQAALGIKNAQLLAETEQRVRHATALARILSTLSFDRPVDETMNMLASNVVDATGAVACTLTILEPQTGQHVLSGIHGLPHGFPAAMRECVARGAPSAAHAAMRSRRQLMVTDAREQMLESGLFEPLHGLVRDAEWSAVVLTPLIFRGRELGSLDVYYRSNLEAEQAERPFLAAIADQIAVAAENLNLFTQLDSRVRQVEAVATIAANLTFDQAINTMLGVLAESVVNATPAIAAAVALLEPDTDELSMAAYFGLPDGYAEAIAASWNRRENSISAQALESRRPVVVRDQPQRLLEHWDYKEAHPYLRQASWRTVIAVPILYRGEGRGVLIGYYPAEAEPGRLDEEYLTGIADQAAVAIENARLFERAQSLAAVEERQRLARELHDSVSQALYGIGLGARTARTLLDTDPQRAVEPVDYVLSLAEAGLAEMRALIFELRPESLETEGLAEALSKQAASMRARHGIAVDANLCPEPEVPLDTKEALYRIGKEALHNTVKHARASIVSLRLACDDDRIVLEVSDDGSGFDPDRDFPGHLGLKSMRERATRLGGTLDISSASGQGTRITVAIPIVATAE